MSRKSCARSRDSRSISFLTVHLLEDRSLPSSTAATFPSLAVDAARYVPDHVLVALKPGTGLANFSAVGKNSVTLDAASGLMEVVLKPGVSVPQGVAFFQAQSYVRYAQPDYLLSAATVPNDPSFSQQWGLNNSGSGGVADADIDAPEAWDITTGTNQSVVAIIDTGVDLTHPDLAANIWTNPGEIAGNGVDDDHNGFVDDIHGWNFVSSNNNPNDDNGHGSHVAGIIGAVGNNGVGVAGVDWNVKIMPLKFLDSSGSGALSDAVLALNYAVRNGANVSNNSYGGGGFYQPMYDAIANARAAGHIFVAAAGNSTRNNDTTANYPSNYNLDNVIAVASTTNSDGLSSFSNYGAATVELGAPGSNIYSTYKNHTYATLSGTSMATPFVTGAIALVHDQHPTWTYTQIINQVLNNTDPIAALQGKTITGGRLNLYRAITGQPPVDSTGPAVTTAVFSGTVANTLDKVRLTFSEAIDATTFDTSDIAAFKLNGVDISGVTYTVTPVAGSGNKQFDVAFTSQSTLGTYALTIGPDIADAVGNAMDQNGNGTNGEIPGDQYTATGSITSIQTFNSTDVPKALPDGKTTTSVLTVGQNLTIGKITVKLNLTHTWDGDLKISLKSPAGTTVLLSNRRGGSGDNYTNTVFDSSASLAIGNGTAPFAGTYRPEQLLTTFNNKNAIGTWSLIVQDMAAGDSGTLNSWSITVTPASGASSLTTTGSAGAEKTTTFFGPIVATSTATAPSAAQSVRSTRSTAAAPDTRQPLAVSANAVNLGFLVTSMPTANANDRWLDFDPSEPFAAMHGLRLT